MTEFLSEAQARFALRQFSRWLRLKEEHERDFGRGEKRWYPGELRRHIPDVDHSALLFRLLRGREPLPEPPPLENGYPVYPDWPYVDEAEA